MTYDSGKGGQTVIWSPCLLQRSPPTHSIAVQRGEWDRRALTNAANGIPSLDFILLIGSSVT